MQAQAVFKVFLCVFLFSKGWLYSMDSDIPEENTFFSVLTVVEPPLSVLPHIPLIFTLPRPRHGGGDVYFLRDPRFAIAIHDMKVNGEIVNPFLDRSRGVEAKPSFSTPLSAVQYSIQVYRDKLSETRLETINGGRVLPLKDEPYYMLVGTIASDGGGTRMFPIPLDAHTIEITYSGIYQKKGGGMHHGTEKYRLVLSNEDILYTEHMNDELRGFILIDTIFEVRQRIEQRQNAEKESSSENLNDNEEKGIEQGEAEKNDPGTDQ